uniref:Putative secreted protein n=1 Tax=Ixodes ricinus TaxID=34613 RepID=A0A6B0UC01_IXORI
MTMSMSFFICLVSEGGLGDAFSTGGRPLRFLAGGSSSWMSREAPPPFRFPPLRSTLAEGPAPPPLPLGQTDLRDRFLVSISSKLPSSTARSHSLSVSASE